MLTPIQGLETHYQEAGAGSPVLLLHGWASSSEALAGVAAALAPAFRVVSVDLPGFGWSQPPPEAWGTADYARHVLAVLDQLKIRTAAVLGHSFGGRVAIVLAAQHPERVARLALVASAGVRLPPSAKARLMTGTTTLLRRLARVPGAGRPVEQLLRRWRERVGSRDYRAAGGMRPTLVRVVNEDLAPLFPRIGVPTLLLWGDRDQEVRRPAVDVMAQAIPGARLVVFPGAGHFPFQDAPDAFQRELIGFLGTGGTW